MADKELESAVSDSSKVVIKKQITTGIRQICHKSSLSLIAQKYN